MEKTINLPRLKKVDVNRPKKKKILLLADDIVLTSGISTMAREIVLGTIDKYDWVQLAAALNHPDNGKAIDMSSAFEEDLGLSNLYFIRYCHTGYGTPEILREILIREHPDALMLFTDPRHWYWFWPMEYEIRTIWKIPISYLSIWDSPPAALYNKAFYQSCDLIMSISKQSDILTKIVLGANNFVDIDSNYESEHQSAKPFLSYVPHGSSEKFFFPQTESCETWEDYCKFEEDFRKKNQCDFIVFWQNRNIRRKQPGDVILGFRRFCDRLPKEQASRCVLLMKTQIADENGTDLLAVKKAICPDYRIVFIQDIVNPVVMNYLYNISDVTVSMSSAEGFGLSFNESLHCGTIICGPVTGGLQDQMRFEDDTQSWINFTTEFTSNHKGRYKKHGPWAFPIWPSARVLQGSIPTPYIFDDYSDAEDLASSLLEIYNLPKEIRIQLGEEGRKWVNSKESGMSSSEMCSRVIRSLDKLLNTWQPPQKSIIEKFEVTKNPSNLGITFE